MNPGIFKDIRDMNTQEFDQMITFLEKKMSQETFYTAPRDGRVRTIKRVKASDNIKRLWVAAEMEKIKEIERLKELEYEKVSLKKRCIIL